MPSLNVFFLIFPHLHSNIEQASHTGERVYYFV